MHPSAWKADSPTFLRKYSHLAHLRDACPSHGEYAAIVMWSRDRRVRAQDRYRPLLLDWGQLPLSVDSGEILTGSVKGTAPRVPPWWKAKY